MKKILLMTVFAALGFGILAGCSTDENPVSPEKMSELRKQEGEERANFNPQGGAPPSGQ